MKKIFVLLLALSLVLGCLGTSDLTKERKVLIKEDYIRMYPEAENVTVSKPELGRTPYSVSGIINTTQITMRVIFVDETSIPSEKQLMINGKAVTNWIPYEPEEAAKFRERFEGSE